MYAPLKTAIGADTDPTLAKKVAAGSASGAIATFITNPIELLKTRLQSCSTMGPVQVLRKVVRKEGITGLWKGTMPSAVSRSNLLIRSPCQALERAHLQLLKPEPYGTWCRAGLNWCLVSWFLKFKEGHFGNRI